MNKSHLFLVISFFVLCSNPISSDNKGSIITCLNGISYLIRYNHYPQRTCPEHFATEVTTNKWKTLDLPFDLNDSLKTISVSPGEPDTLCFDTIWVEDTNHTIKIFTFDYDTMSQLGFGTNTNVGSIIQWKIFDNKTLVYFPLTTVSDTTYSAEIIFTHPIISTGHVKIRLKVFR
jgi:hypothetical protein